jgi:eukaryotic-like serine/threonine-protein kinase
MLGRDYRVLELMGAGEVTAAYLVEHQASRQRFAAKVLSRALAQDPSACARFTQGAHAAARLEHENIASIVDFGVTADHRPFFVMEPLLGLTLDQRLAERPMAIEEVVAVAFPVARALAHSHAHGIIHGDVRPENILLVPGNHGYFGVKVVDVGIVRPPLHALPAKARETLGSSLFMAPEMCRGEPFDLRADLYSFGILLHLMICGRLPFVDGQLRVLQMQLVELPARPRAVNTELSPELAVVVERALAKRPDDRYPSMDALLRDLTAALPMGSDRLLIEAQAGMVLRDLTFSPSGRHELRRSPRASRPPPVGVVSSSQPLAVSSSQPFAIPPRRPPAPPRRRAMLVVATAVATMVIGVVVVRQLATVPASASAREAIAPSGDPLAGSTARPAAASDTQTGQTTPPPAAPGRPPSPPASDDHAESPTAAGEPAPDPAGVADPTEADPAPATAASRDVRPTSIAKKPVARPKLRTGTRVALVMPTEPRHDLNDPGSQRKDRAAPAGPTGKLPLTGTSKAAATGTTSADPGSGAAPAGGRAETAGSRDAPGGSLADPARPAAPADPGTLDATPTVVSLDVKGSLSPAMVRRSVERTLAAMRTCYRTAARAGGTTPAVDLRLTFEIDENRLATQIGTSGASFGSLATCAAGVASQIRTQEAPDVGTVQVAIVIRFRPS